MSSVPLLYRMAVRTVRRAAPLFARDGSKLARGLAGRRAAHEVLAAWGERERDPERPTAWFHAPSVGEGLQAQAVMRAARGRRPTLQVAFTHFSPSAESFGRRIGADVSTYLPWDMEDPVSRVLDAVRPDLLVFTKTEVWPVLVEGAHRRGVPVAIVGATVPPGAGRTRWLARSVLRSTWGRLSVACASSDEDAARLVELGVAERLVVNTGDPGIDSALRRAGEAEPSARHLAPFHEDPRPTVVAGSIWPDDEAVLLPALVEVRRAVPELRVILAPHEPSEAGIAALLERLRALGWEAVTLSEVESEGSAGGAGAVVVDRVGVLAQLYTVGRAAYVGGGFRREGLHSVVEPAAARVPVVFGPRHRSSRAAGALLAAGGAESVADAQALAGVLSAWLTDPAKRGDAAERAFGYIDAHRGAAARTAELLDPLITARRQA